MRLWDSGSTEIDGAILAFTVGEDPVLDKVLLPYDCIGSAAHVEMLATIGVLNEEEREALRDALSDAFIHASTGRLGISQEQEDCHTALEAWVTQCTGEAGKKVHTGRSRNDQVITALRLYVREQLLQLAAVAADLVEVALKRGRQHRSDLMPGYTHTRQAMPSTVGQLFFSLAECLIRNIEAFVAPLKLANRSPLGSASGYGVPLPLDRQLVSDLLGFDGPDINTIYVQQTRGLLEASVLSALHQLTLSLSRFAADLIWFSSEAFGFFHLPQQLTTGSSIMPQKQNPDVLELIRVAPASILGRYNAVTTALHGLPSGYHRDLQKTKGPLVRSFIDTFATLVVMRKAVDGLKVDTDKCAAALTPDIFATDRTFALVRGGMAFRDAYRKIKESEPEAMANELVFAGRDHLGAPGTDQTESLRAALIQVQQELVGFAAGATRSRELVNSPDI